MTCVSLSRLTSACGEVLRGTPGNPAHPGTPGFSTPTPDLPVATDTQPIAGDGTVGGVGGGPLGALAVVATLLLTPFWGFLTGKLADNSLKAVVTTCPQGLDQPIPTGGN